MSSTVTFSCTPRLGSFVVEIPPMTWSHSGFTEMGCYKPSPATWVVGLSIDVFLHILFHIPMTMRFRNVVGCGRGCWWFRTPGQSFPFDILIILPLSVFGSAAWFHDVFCQTFLAKYLWKLKRCHCESWWIYPPGARMPVCHQDYCIFSGGSL